MATGPKKKLATELVDKRNGIRYTPIPATQVMQTPEGLSGPAIAAWNSYWADGVSGILTPVDEMLVVRWIDAVNRYCRFSAMADAEPLVRGSQGQMVPNPLFQVANAAIQIAERCEKQLGMGAKYRAALGLAVVTAADAAARHRRNELLSTTDRVDPRLADRE
ncbi:hypothetical protein GCM10022403_087270 [Streptomyces coacervatus]|uniref:P27 family phage terminase small subunit n=1 Tax=Streptomyces coacervatus TaxID=647381 RepID=A0ABP7JE65_9ACTN|nr:P27 family phage terminase small subunit [Streptomyces coacervatus]MDF2273390.1 hypothetical protein [Streptomyces coacervatus]